MREAGPIKKIIRTKFFKPKVAIFHAESEIGLKDDFKYIPRPLEAVSALKSPFGGVAE